MMLINNLILVIECTGWKILNLHRFLSIIILISIQPSVYAQFGVKLGTTASSFYYSGDEPAPYFDYDIDLRPYLGYDIELVQTGNQKPFFGSYISGYYDVDISKRFSVRPEISFAQKGVNFNKANYESIIYKVIISYIEIPVSLSYQLIQKEKLIVELYFGGYGSMKVGAIKKVGYQKDPVEKTKITAVKDFDGGFHFGSAFKRRLLNNFVLIDLRVFIGLSNIFSTPDGWTEIYYETQKTKITGFNLSLGYEF